MDLAGDHLLLPKVYKLGREILFQLHEHQSKTTQIMMNQET
jgi:hypothetical protein